MKGVLIYISVLISISVQITISGHTRSRSKSELSRQCTVSEGHENDNALHCRKAVQLVTNLGCCCCWHANTVLCACRGVYRYVFVR